MKDLIHMSASFRYTYKGQRTGQQVELCLVSVNCLVVIDHTRPHTTSWLTCWLTVNEQPYILYTAIK